MSRQRRSDIDLLEAFSGVRIKFWKCPISGHSRRNGPDGWPVLTVEWEGDLARCTAPDCGRTNQTREESHD